NLYIHDLHSFPTRRSSDLIPDLHSTMYLLISRVTCNNSVSTNKFTFHYVSINIQEPYNKQTCVLEFTFHYVSINIILVPLDNILDRKSTHLNSRHVSNS